MNVGTMSSLVLGILSLLFHNFVLMSSSDFMLRKSSGNGVPSYARNRVLRFETRKHPGSRRWSYLVSDFYLSLRCIVNPTLLRLSSPITEPAKKVPSTSCSKSSCIDPLCLQPTWQASCFSPRLLVTPSMSRKYNSEQAAATLLPKLVAESIDARSNSFVGTPHEYLAPEILKGEGHGSAVDWWTYGIFLFELLYGKTPFKGSSNEETLANVVSEPLRFPEIPLVTYHAKDLIRGLLMKNPENRLGFPRGATELKQHAFLEGLNWALIRCAVPPERPKFCDVRNSEISSQKQNGKSFGIGNSEHIEFELF